MRKKYLWFIMAIGAILISIVTLFIPVIRYTNQNGEYSDYNIIRLIKKDEFIDSVVTEYKGSFLRSLSDQMVGIFLIVLCIVAATAIALAFIGLISMAKQYESVGPFRLAICGLIGTIIPSVLLFILFLFSKNQYMGEMQLGAYIYVTPAAMIIACLAVTSRHRKSLEQRRLMEEAKAYIYPAGDLAEKQQRGRQNYGQ